MREQEDKRKGLEKSTRLLFLKVQKFCSKVQKNKERRTEQKDDKPATIGNFSLVKKYVLKNLKE